MVSILGMMLISGCSTTSTLVVDDACEIFSKIKLSESTKLYLVEKAKTGDVEAASDIKLIGTHNCVYHDRCISEVDDCKSYITE